MPEPRLKREASEPQNQIAHREDQLISALLTSVVQEVCSAMSANGAFIAVRDSEGVRCLASTGEAPSAGSQLQLDSTFTRECLETGNVVLCEDAEHDSRIQPSVAKSLHLRSAVAVPIHSQGSIVGIIEVFSSRSIYAVDVTPLQGIANFLAPILGSGSEEGAQLVERSPIVARAEASSSPEEQPERPQSVALSPPECQLDSQQRTTEQKPASVGDIDDKGNRVLEIAEPIGRFDPTRGVFRRLAGKSTQVRAWLAGATFLLFLALLFLVTGSHHKATKRPVDTGVSPGSGGPRREEREMEPTKSQNRESLKDSDRFSRPGVALSTASPPLPKAAEEKIGEFPNPRAAPVEGGEARTSNLSRRPTGGSSAVLRDSQPLRVGSGEKIVSSPGPSLAIEGLKLEPFEPMEPANSAILALTPATPPPIKPRTISPPDFVLHQTLKGHSGWVTGVAFSSDGQRLASGSWDQTIRFWDVPTGQELNTVEKQVKEVQALAFSRDGRWLAAENSSDTVTLWDATTGREIRTLASNRPLGTLGSNWVYSIAFSPDGRWLASGVDDKTVRLWDVTTGRAVRDLTASRRSVIYVAFSPDGRWLASGDDDKSIRIWEVSTGRAIRTLSGHKKLIYSVAFSPNGRWLASASADKSIKLWDIATGREVHTLTGHGNLVTSLAFSPDGRWLASGSWDKTVKIWDVETGLEVQTLTSTHNHSVYSVAFDSRGRWLAAGSEDGTISVWRLSRPEDQTSLQ